MCTTVYTEDALRIGNGRDFYLAPTSSTSFPIGVGFMEWTDDLDAEKVPSYENSKVLSIEEATALRDSLTQAINAELAAPGAARESARERAFAAA